MSVQCDNNCLHVSYIPCFISRMMNWWIVTLWQVQGQKNTFTKLPILIYMTWLIQGLKSLLQLPVIFIREYPPLLKEECKLISPKTVCTFHDHSFITFWKFPLYAAIPCVCSADWTLYFVQDLSDYTIEKVNPSD